MTVRIHSKTIQEFLGDLEVDDDFEFVERITFWDGERIPPIRKAQVLEVSNTSVTLRVSGIGRRVIMKATAREYRKTGLDEYTLSLEQMLPETLEIARIRLEKCQLSSDIRRMLSRFEILPLDALRRAKALLDEGESA